MKMRVMRLCCGSDRPLLVKFFKVFLFFNGISYKISKEDVLHLLDNLATIHCTVYENFNAGDHVIVTGYVHDVIQ